MKLEKYNKIIKNTPQETKAEIRFYMDVLDRIHELLILKFGGKQKLLAARMGKSEAEISKLLSGVQNYTMKTIFKFEIAFGEQIMAVCSESYVDATYVLVKLTPNTKHTRMQVDCGGEISEKVVQYENFIPTSKIKEDTNKNILV